MVSSGELSQRNLTKLPKINELELAAFLAGECAERRYRYHEWGPEPPRGAAAFLHWKNQCAAGHSTFDISEEVHRSLQCGHCTELKRRGRVV